MINGFVLPVSNYPEHIQSGIRIHREIDSFTDTHPLFKKGTKRLHSNYGKFAGMDKRMGSISGMGRAILELRIYKDGYTKEFSSDLK